MFGYGADVLLSASRDATAGARPGCYACFGTLAPLEGRKRKEGVVASHSCTGCGAGYHAPCWNKTAQCFNCGSHQAQASVVPPLAPPHAVRQMRALPIRPSAVIYAVPGTNPPDFSDISPWRHNARFLAQLARSVALAVVLVGVSALVGILIARAAQLDDPTIDAVMRAITRRTVPSTLVIVRALIAAVLVAVLYYPNPPDREFRPHDGTWFLWRFAAACAGVLLLDAFTLDIPAPIAGGAKVGHDLLRELLSPQDAAALVSLLCIPLQRALAPRTERLWWWPPRMANAWGWIRLLLVALLVVLASGTVAIARLSPDLDGPVVATATLGAWVQPITQPLVGAMLAALTVGLILYHAPAYRHLRGRSGIVRLLLSIASIAAVGLLYPTTTDPTGYRSAVEVAVVVAFIAIPLQRALS